MSIKSSAELRNNYRKVADLAKSTGEPIFLTNKGEGELVVMSIAAWEEERFRLQVEQVLLAHEADEAAGTVSYTPASEVIAELRGITSKKRAGATIE